MHVQYLPFYFLRRGQNAAVKGQRGHHFLLVPPPSDLLPHAVLRRNSGSLVPLPRCLQSRAVTSFWDLAGRRLCRSWLSLARTITGETIFASPSPSRLGFLLRSRPALKWSLVVAMVGCAWGLHAILPLKVMCHVLSLYLSPCS